MTGTQTEFRSFAMKAFTHLVMPKLATRGEQYTDEDQSALANFETSAMLFQSEPERELLGLASKHWNALCLWSASRRTGGLEVIAERAVDIIVYMMLLLFALQERHDVDFPIPQERD